MKKKWIKESEDSLSDRLKMFRSLQWVCVIHSKRQISYSWPFVICPHLLYPFLLIHGLFAVQVTFLFLSWGLFPGHFLSLKCSFSKNLHGKFLPHKRRWETFSNLLYNETSMTTILKIIIPTPIIQIPPFLFSFISQQLSTSTYCIIYLLCELLVFSLSHTMWVS